MRKRGLRQALNRSMTHVNERGHGLKGSIGGRSGFFSLGASGMTRGKSLSGNITECISTGPIYVGSSHRTDWHIVRS